MSIKKKPPTVQGAKQIAMTNEDYVRRGLNRVIRPVPRSKRMAVAGSGVVIISLKLFRMPV